MRRPEIGPLAPLIGLILRFVVGSSRFGEIAQNFSRHRPDGVKPNVAREQQPVAQARLRQPDAALRTNILTHRALPTSQLALGTSYDLYSRSVSMQGLKIEQSRGK